MFSRFRPVSRSVSRAFSRSVSRAFSHALVPSVFVYGSLVLVGCKKDPEPIKETPPPPALSQQAVKAGQKRFVVDAAGKTTITIPAPDETFKGATSVLSGELRIDLDDLSKSIAEIDTDLETLKTFTFADADDNTAQTKHAHNWFELGEDDGDMKGIKTTDPKKFADYKLAHFYVDSVDESSAKTLAEVAEKDGARTVTFKVTGRLRVHGRDAKKTIRVQLAFKGPADAPTSLAFKTLDPLVASLSEHDVKPRDAAGKFLSTTLGAIGKKLDDKAQVQLEGTAR